MHELSAAISIVQTLLKVARERSVRKIKAVRLEVGDLTLLNPDQLRFCFEVAARGTLAEGAELRIERKPTVLRCQKCNRVFEWAPEEDPLSHLLPLRLACTCRSTDVKVESGRELRVVSMTAEKAARQAHRGKGHGGGPRVPVRSGRSS